MSGAKEEQEEENKDRVSPLNAQLEMYPTGKEPSVVGQKGRLMSLLLSRRFPTSRVVV